MYTLVRVSPYSYYAVSVALKAWFVMSLYVPKKSPMTDKMGLASPEDF